MTPEQQAVRPGDWVRFQRDGRLVIGLVEYLLPRKSWEAFDRVITDAGEVRADSVLEVRHAE